MAQNAFNIKITIYKTLMDTNSTDGHKYIGDKNYYYYYALDVSSF